MNKVSHLRTARQNLSYNSKFVNNIGQSSFVDKHRQTEEAGLRIPFKIKWSTLCHMHDLRLWTITYAPSTQNNLQRMQEMHRINNEALYMISNSLYKRIIAGAFLFLFIKKFAKQRYLNNGAKDSHDISWRDSTATL